MLFPSLILACPSSLRLLSSSLESRLLPWQHRYGTPKRRDHRRPPEKRRDGRKRERLVRLLTLLVSFRPPDSSSLLGLFLPISSPSYSSWPDQMFEKINKTLPADSFLRLLFLRRVCTVYSVSLPSLFSLSLCLLYSTLSFSRVATVRHFVCVTCREKPLQ